MILILFLVVSNNDIEIDQLKITLWSLDIGKTDIIENKHIFLNCINITSLV